jgi:hypothetical protein
MTRPAESRQSPGFPGRKAMIFRNKTYKKRDYEAAFGWDEDN